MLLRFSFRFAVALATFLCGITMSKVLPPYHLSATADPQIEQEVLSVERAYIDAHLQRDTTALDRLLTDDFTFSRPFGSITDKAQRLALVSDPDFAFTDIETEHPSVTVDGDRAYISGQARVHMRYGSSCMHREVVSPWYAYTRTLERHDGRWQIASVRVNYLMSR
jgi:ketosteroid isomerase-like protein